MNDGPAVEHRITQATKVFYKWCQVLQCRAVGLHLRYGLLVATVFAAVLWLSETWHPTTHQRTRLESWGARLMARTARTQRQLTEDPVYFWRRRHRIGHTLMADSGGGLDARRRARLHSFAGHLARSATGLPATALRTRSLAWWRAMQSQNLFPHPQRFRVWRWETQLEEHYGRHSSVFIDENVGWMQKAQQKTRWRTLGISFAQAGFLY